MLSSSSSSEGGKLRVYVDYLSQPSRAVLLLLKENNVPHEVVRVNLGKGENLTEEYKKINPNRKVPAIDDSGFTLWESHTIMRYLCTTRRLPSHWYPSDPKARAAVDRMLDWHHTNLRPASSGLTFSRILAPASGLPVDEKRAAEFEKNLKASLRSMEQFLAKSKFLSADTISIADLSLACETAQLSLMQYDLSPWPRVSQWMEQVRTTLKSWDEVNLALKKVANKQAQRSKL